MDTLNNNLFNSYFVKIYNLLFIISLILYLTNFIYGIGYYSFVIISPFILFFFFYKNINRKILIVVLILFLFSVIYTLITYMYEYIDVGLIPAYVSLPVLTYIFGYLVGEKDYKYKSTYCIIFVLLITVSGYGLLSYLRTIYVFGELGNAWSALGARAIGSFWSPTMRIKATELAVDLSFGLALIPVIFVPRISRNQKWFFTSKLVTIICFVISVFILIQLGSRSSIIVIVMSFVFFYIFIGRVSIKNILILFITCIVVFLTWLLFNFNVFNLKGWLESTSTYNRFIQSGLESGRFEAWTEIIDNFFRYPLGGKKIDINLNYAHNLWLDVLYNAGWIVFIPLIIFTFISLITLIKFIAINHPLYIRSIILTIFVAFFFFFMTEPILSGRERSYFILFCLFSGIIEGLNIRARRFS